MIINEEEYIEHHGVKGQRWGVRRYQNYDGSLTDQGKRHKLLKSFDSQKITKESLKDFSNQYKQLSHVRVSGNTDGKLYSKNGKLVGMINTEQKDDGHVWIQGLEVFGDNQGRGLGTALLDEAVTNLNADRLSVNKNNIKAKRLYDKYGFDIYDQDDTMYYMEISARHSFNSTDVLMHHGVKGQHWGVRNGPPYPLNSNVSISKKSYDKINDIYKKMPSVDRRRVDPDSKDGDDYYPSYNDYVNKTAYNGIKNDGFIIAEKIPKYANVDDTHGIEVGVGVLSKGKGTGTSLVKDMTDWFDKQDDYDTIWWPVDSDNSPSIGLAVKCGFIKDPYGDNYIYAKDEALIKLGIEDHISHHGVKGQHWGVQNGPPYPIGRSGQTLSNGNAKLLKNYNGPAYFVSEKKFEDMHLTPRVPNNYMTKHGFEDSETPRVSFAPTIEQCLAGLSQNLDDKTFYVYEPVDISKCEVYKPNNKAVPDSDITNELWVTNPVDIRPVKKIKITGNKGEDGKEYSYGQDKAILFDDWTFETID